jgi:hypothetical protein
MNQQKPIGAFFQTYLFWAGVVFALFLFFMYARGAFAAGGVGLYVSIALGCIGLVLAHLYDRSHARGTRED